MWQELGERERHLSPGAPGRLGCLQNGLPDGRKWIGWQLGLRTASLILLSKLGADALDNEGHYGRDKFSDARPTSITSVLCGLSYSLLLFFLVLMSVD